VLTKTILFVNELLRNFSRFAIWYSLSSERLVDMKITKFYTEKVIPSARKILNIYILQAVTFFCPEIMLELMHSSAFCSVGLQAYN
jgi:hypothetical protein